MLLVADVYRFTEAVLRGEFRGSDSNHYTRYLFQRLQDVEDHLCYGECIEDYAESVDAAVASDAHWERAEVDDEGILCIWKTVWTEPLRQTAEKP